MKNILTCFGCIVMALFGDHYTNIHFVRTCGLDKNKETE